MRIIGGKHGGRRITPPRRIPARPTTDIAKEGLFNILNNYIDFEEVKFLDLFGGTGCISYEFASRGCEDITLIELDVKSLRFIKETSDKLNMNINALRMNVFKYIDICKDSYDMIFAGPPYALKNLPEIPDLIFSKGLLKKGGTFIMEHNPNHNFEDHPNFEKKRNYGSTIFAFFKNIETDKTEEE